MRILEIAKSKRDGATTFILMNGQELVGEVYLERDARLFAMAEQMREEIGSAISWLDDRQHYKSDLTPTGNDVLRRLHAVYHEAKKAGAA